MVVLFVIFEGKIKKIKEVFPVKVSVKYFTHIKGKGEQSDC